MLEIEDNNLNVTDYRIRVKVAALMLGFKTLLLKVINFTIYTSDSHVRLACVHFSNYNRLLENK